MRFMTTKNRIAEIFVIILALVILVAGAAAAQEEEIKGADFINAQGESIGTVRFTEGPGGVLIAYDLRGLTQGVHAFHIHEKGICDAAGKFESAGAHFSPGGHEHGHMAEGGPHEGDMGNINAAADGTARGDALNQMVTFAGRENRAALNDSDGASLIIHAAPDDYTTQPSGAAGERIACAIIAPPADAPAAPAAP
jgi:Cu-Zn family superoxide dismutase